MIERKIEVIKIPSVVAKYNMTLEQMMAQSPDQEDLNPEINTDNFPTFGVDEWDGSERDIYLARVFTGEEGDWRRGLASARILIQKAGLVPAEFPAIVAITPLWPELRKLKVVNNILSFGQHSINPNRIKALGLFNLRSHHDPQYGLYPLDVGLRSDDYIICDKG